MTPTRLARLFTGARAPHRTALLLWAALVAGVALAATDARDLDLSAVRNVDASTVNGGIVVTVDPSSTGVTVEHRGNVDYDVTVRGDTLTLEGRNRSLICINCEVTFTVRVPHSVSLSLRTTNGHVSVTGAMERVDAATTNGNVTTAETGPAPLDLKTTNGRIEVRGAGAEIRARTTNGSVELRDVDLPSGSDNRIQSTNGSVTVQGLSTSAALDISGRLSNGGIHVSLADFDVSYPNTRSFHAMTPGNGSASLTLETANGSLTVTR